MNSQKCNGETIIKYRSQLDSGIPTPLNIHDISSRFAPSEAVNSPLARV
jgi:hypothetical protein